MNIIITTEATADLPKSQLREDLKIIPMGYTVNGVAYDGDKEFLSSHEFYNSVANAKTKEDLPTTTMVTSYTATQFFEEILQQGNDIIHIAFSSSLSGTYDQECMAIKELKSKYPKRKITIINSLSASYVEGFIVYYALKKKDEGATYEELVDYINDIRLKACGLFVIDDLNHLVRTGRATKNEAYIGTALHIKPILCIDNDGTLKPFKKVMSQKLAFKEMFRCLESKVISKDNYIAVGSADAEDDVDFLENQLKTLGYTNIGRFEVGPVIGTHVGKGMCAIVFLGKDRIF